MVVRTDILPGRNRKKRERLPDIGIASNETSNCDLSLGRSKQPAGLALLIGLSRGGIFVKAVGQHEASVAGEFAAVGPHIENRFAIGRRPGPAAFYQFRYAAVGIEPNDWRLLGDPDVPRLEVGDAFRKFERDLNIRKQAPDRVGAFFDPVKIAHGLSRTNSKRMLRPKSA